MPLLLALAAEKEDWTLTAMTKQEREDVRFGAARFPSDAFRRKTQRTVIRNRQPLPAVHVAPTWMTFFEIGMQWLEALARPTAGTYGGTRRTRSTF
jgi:hypothetical protein